MNWTENVAVASKQFVEATKNPLGISGKGPRGSVGNGGYELRKSTTPYRSDFDPQNAALNQEYTYYWNESI